MIQSKAANQPRNETFGEIILEIYFFRTVLTFFCFLYHITLSISVMSPSAVVCMSLSNNSCLHLECNRPSATLDIIIAKIRICFHSTGASVICIYQNCYMLFPKDADLRGL